MFYNLSLSATVYVKICSCVYCPMGIDVTAFCYLFYLRISRGKEKGKGGKKPPKKEIRCRVFSDVNRIGRPKAVSSFPIFLGRYKQLLKSSLAPNFFFFSNSYNNSFTWVSQKALYYSTWYSPPRCDLSLVDEKVQVWWGSPGSWHFWSFLFRCQVQILHW